VSHPPVPESFQASFIEDDRHDYRGNYHDLSKSVYRTVRMRISRTLELNLQKYTSVQEITSRSPIDLTFIQYVDLHMLIELWNRLHLVEYLDSVAKPIVTAVKEHSEFQVNWGEIVPLLIVWALTDGKNRLPKKKAKEALENAIAQPDSNKTLTDLTETLVRSILVVS
jgi:hypothetical protein